MNDLHIKMLCIGETHETILPEKYAIKLTKRGNKTPVAIIQMKRVETRLEPSEEDIYYSTTSRNQIHKIMKYYPSITEFKKKNPEMGFFNNCCWKEKVERMINK